MDSSGASGKMAGSGETVTRMREKLQTGVLLAALIPTIAAAKDCTISKQFRVNQKQVFAGVIQDPHGAGLPGIDMELLDGKKVLQHQQTDSQGKYHFEAITPGTYRIHVRTAGGAFCAPVVNCGAQGCSADPRLALNPKLKPVIVR